MRLDRPLLLIPLSAAALLVVTWIAPGRDGPYALLTILAPHGALAALALTAILVLVARGGVLRFGLVALAVVLLARFGSEWASIPSTAGPASTTVATWNLEYSDVDGRAAVAGLADLEADVVALQEVTIDQAAAIEASTAITERFPYRRLEPGSGNASGIGLLSRHPLTDVDYVADPVMLHATVDTGNGPFTFLNAHPYPARIAIDGILGMPVAFDPSDRDRRLAEVRQRLDAAIDSGVPAILIGDFNTAPTEAAFGELTADLTDAHVEVGQGPGWTWRPSLLGRLPMGVLRIDLVLSTEQLVPTSSQVDCPPVGDHCMVIATFTDLD